MTTETSDNELNPLFIYSSLSQQSKEFESREGLRAICEFVDSRLKKGESLEFIDQYREIIRTNKWHDMEENVSLLHAQ